MPPRSRSGADDEKAPASDTTTSTATPSTTGSDSTEKKSSESSSSGTAYLNVSGTPLVYDNEGHQVDAGTWTPEINLDKVGRALRKGGLLLPRSEL